MATDMQQKKVYRQKLISYTFIFSFIWTMAFSAITLGGIILLISGDKIPLVPILAVGVMSAVGWIIFGPIVIHRKKIVIKDGVLSAHKMLPKVYYHIVDRWEYNPRLSHLPDLESKPLSVAVTGGASLTRGKIVRFSWRVRRQHIDLSQIVEIRRLDISIAVKRAHADWALNIDLDVIMLRDKSGVIHIVEITDFRNKHKEEILNLIQVDPSALDDMDVRPVIIPKPVVRLSRKQKKEAELAAQEYRRKALLAEQKKQVKRQLDEQVRISKEAGKYSVILTKAGTYLDGIIALIIELTGKSEHEAQEGIKNLPYLVITGIDREEAMSLANRLLAADRDAHVAIK